MRTPDTPGSHEAPSGRPRSRTLMALALLAGLVGCGNGNPYEQCVSDAKFHQEDAEFNCRIYPEGAQSLCEEQARAGFNQELNACIQEIHADDPDCHGVGMNDNDSDRDGLSNSVEAMQGSDMCDEEDTGRLR
jgi:hypothetical protein